MSSSSPATQTPPTLTRSKRFMWMVILISGYGFAMKFLGISARQEMLFEEMLGDWSKLSSLTQTTFQWQRWLGANFLYLVPAGLIVLLWIGFARSARRVQGVVLTLTGFLALQAVISIAIPYPEILQQIRSLSAMKTTE